MHLQDPHVPPVQLDFSHARARARGPVRPPRRERARDHAANLARVAGRTETLSPAREPALDAFKRSLVEFVRGIGVGNTFQSADFTRWLDATGQRPHPDLVDMHTLGGLILGLRSAGLIEFLRHEQTGSYGGANSSARGVYRVVSLDTSKLAWSALRSEVTP